MDKDHRRMGLEPNGSLRATAEEYKAEPNRIVQERIRTLFDVLQRTSAEIDALEARALGDSDVKGAVGLAKPAGWLGDLDRLVALACSINARVLSLSDKF